MPSSYFSAPAISLYTTLRLNFHRGEVSRVEIELNIIRYQREPALLYDIMLIWEGKMHVDPALMRCYAHVNLTLSTYVHITLMARPRCLDTEGHDDIHAKIRFSNLEVGSFSWDCFTNWRWARWMASEGTSEFRLVRALPTF